MDTPRPESYLRGMPHHGGETPAEERAGRPRRARARRVTSARNPHLVQLRRWLARPERARRDGVLAVEGRHVAEEALAAGWKPRLVVTGSYLEEEPDLRSLRDRLEGAASLALRIPRGLVETLSQEPSPPGIFTVWDLPLSPPGLPNPGQVRTVLAMVDVQDPGNVGSLLRSAAAFGVGGVLLLGGTAGYWHPKVVRASVGCVFRLRWWQRPATEALEATLHGLRRAGWRLLALDPRGPTPLRPGRPVVPPPWVLFVGSEGHGLPPAVLEAAQRRIRIPMPGRLESLGVAAAGAVALFALSQGPRRKRR
jgi:TrmH family RNA methyltransferase